MWSKNWASVLFSVVIAVIATLPLSGDLSAQSTVSVPKFGTYEGTIDTINVGAMGTMSIRIPLYHIHKRGRNLDQDIALVYSDRLYNNTPISGNWTLIQANGYQNGITIVQTMTPCTLIGPTPGVQLFNTYSYIDELGVKSDFPAVSSSQCMPYNGGTAPQYNTVSNVPASNGGGALLDSGFGSTATVTDIHGNVYSSSLSWPIGQVRDPNGNKGTVGPLVGGKGMTCPNGTAPSPQQASVGNTPVITPGCYTYDSSNTITGRSPGVISYLDVSGNPQSITINFKAYDVSTQYGNESACVPSSTNVCVVKSYLVDSIVFPDSTQYSFTYESDVSGLYSGRIKTVTLPSGGTITYSRSGGPNNVGVDLSKVSGVVYTLPVGTVNTLTRVTADGTTTYSSEVLSAKSGMPTATQSTTTYPDNHQEVANFVYSTITGSIADFYETSRTVYRGSVGGQIMKSSTRLYNGASSATNESFSLPITKLETTSTENGLSLRNVQVFNNVGLMTENDDYDVGGSSIIRKTVMSYKSLGNNIQDRPDTITAYDGSGSVAAQTTFSYDEYSLSSSGVSGLATVTGSRGNQTSASSLVSPSAYATTHAHYDDAGQVVCTVDANHANVTSCGTSTTNFGYDPTDTYVTSATYPSVAAGTFSVSYKVDSNTGLITQSTDINNKSTGLSYDSMLRSAGLCSPDGGYTKTAFSLTSVTTSVLTGATGGCTIGGSVPTGPWITGTKEYDGYGRLAHSIDSAGNTVDYSYDSMGRLYSASNPHNSGTTCSSNCIVYYLYDVLGRKVKQTNQDGTAEYWCYNGVADPTAKQPNCHSSLGSKSGTWVDFQDENGNQWQRTSDGLGRLVQVMEPNGTSQAASMETDYFYDPLGNLRSVTQWGGSNGASGSRTRSFSYDSMSRLLQSYNPEAGWVCYGTTGGAVPNGSNCTTTGSYDGNGNLLAKTDGRGITTGYSYDAWNRLTNKSYQRGSISIGPSYQYIYDQYQTSNICSGCAASQFSTSSPIGRMTESYSSNNKTRSVYAYDSMGRITAKASCFSPSGACNTGTSFGQPILYAYDFVGSPTSSTNGVSSTGIQLIYGYDSAEHLDSLTSSWSGDARHPGTLFSGTTYDAFGNLHYATYGTSGSGQFYLNQSFDNRARVGQKIYQINNPN